MSVNPEVLKWARATAGASQADAAKRAGRDIETIEMWEKGKAQPTFAALNELAALYRRTLAAMLLPEPPLEPAAPPDFRAAQGKTGKLSRDSLLAIRLAGWLQSVAREFGMKGMALPSQPMEHQSPAHLAEQHRKALSIPSIEELAPRTDHEVFAILRAAVEEHGVLVFQLSMPLEDLRGFSLAAEQPAALAVGSGDYIRARIFTLFHEYAHILIGAGGLCVPQAHLAPTPTADLERFCNDFAGALLVPHDDLVSDMRVTELSGRDVDPADRDLDPVAARFHVSRQVLWYRMRALELIADKVFRAKWREWGALQDQWRRRAGKGGPGLTTPQKRVLQYGPHFVGHVLGAEARGSASSAEVAEVLGVKVRDLPTLASLVTS